MTDTEEPAPQNRQLEMFLPYLADLNFRDQREVMERPFFSLAKNKRLKPIDYHSPDGKVYVHVSGNPDYGMATIWDADILIYCASVLSDMQRRGINDIPRRLRLMPYDLLRAIDRPTTGRAYELLGQSLDRLTSTTVKTNIRAEDRREATFNWLDGWSQTIDERTERSRGIVIDLSSWFYDGVLMSGGVLSIDRAYFSLGGGRERWLYRVARKHAGGAGEAGFAISMETLFEKSGAEGDYRRFKFELNKIISANNLPGFELAIEMRDGRKEPFVRMLRRPDSSAPRKGDDKSKQSSKAADQLADPKAVDEVVRKNGAKWAQKASEGLITHETRLELQRRFPGWDYDALHQQFKNWVGEDPTRTPTYWQKAFIGFVENHDRKEGWTLR